MRCALLPLLVPVLVISLFAQSPASREWKMYRSEAGNFEALFPGKPTEDTTREKGDVTAHWYAYGSNSTNWLVAWTDQVNGLETPEKMRERMGRCGGIVGNRNGEAPSKILPGHFEWSCILDNEDPFQVMHVISVGPRLYVLSYLTATQNKTGESNDQWLARVADESEQFFYSFDLLHDDYCSQSCQAVKRDEPKKRYVPRTAAITYYNFRGSWPDSFHADFPGEPTKQEGRTSDGAAITKYVVARPGEFSAEVDVVHYQPGRLAKTTAGELVNRFVSDVGGELIGQVYGPGCHSRNDLLERSCTAHFGFHKADQVCNRNAHGTEICFTPTSYAQMEASGNTVYWFVFLDYNGKNDEVKKHFMANAEAK